MKLTASRETNSFDLWGDTFNGTHGYKPQRISEQIHEETVFVCRVASVIIYVLGKRTVF